MNKIFLGLMAFLFTIGTSLSYAAYTSTEPVETMKTEVEPVDAMKTEMEPVGDELKDTTTVVPKPMGDTVKEEEEVEDADDEQEDEDTE